MQPKALTYVLTGLLLGVATGCTSRPAIVSDPPQHVRGPTEQIPWEEEYSRAMIRPEEVGQPAASDVHQDQKFAGPLEQEEQESGPLGVVADVIAFPFRAIGWLFQSIF
jgi:hypothetical protein